MIEKVIYESMKITVKEIEEIIVRVIESCKLHRGIFISKRELINKLEKEMPEYK